MADTAETTSTPTRSSNGNGRTSRARSKKRDEALEDQIDRLQDDLKSIGATIQRMADSRVADARGYAEREVENIVRTGEQAVSGVQDEFGEVEKQIKDTIRAKPLTAVAGAVAIGFVLALLSR